MLELMGFDCTKLALPSSTNPLSGSWEMRDDIDDIFDILHLKPPFSGIEMGVVFIFYIIVLGIIFLH